MEKEKLSQFNDFPTDFPLNLKKWNVLNKSDNMVLIKDMKPCFAFDYINMQQKDIYNFIKGCGASDYKGIFNGLKEISKYTYQTIEQTEKFHFHPINWEKDFPDMSPKDFYKHIYTDNNYNSDDITPYQFKTHGDSRLVGFIYQSIFYIVLFDKGHDIYDRDRKRKKFNRK